MNPRSFLLSAAILAVSPVVATTLLLPNTATATDPAVLDRLVSDILKNIVADRITYQQALAQLRGLSSTYGAEAVKAALLANQFRMGIQYQNILAWALRNSAGMEWLASLSRARQGIGITSMLLEGLGLLGGMGSGLIGIIPPNWQMMVHPDSPGTIGWDNTQAQLIYPEDDSYFAYVDPEAEETEEEPDENNSGGNPNAPADDGEMCCGRSLELVAPLNECFPWPHGGRYPFLDEIVMGASTLDIFDEEYGYTLLGGLQTHFWDRTTQQVTPYFGLHIADPAGYDFIIGLTPALDGSGFCYTWEAAGETF